MPMAVATPESGVAEYFVLPGHAVSTLNRSISDFSVVIPSPDFRNIPHPARVANPLQPAPAS
jgi:hypothetical protein